MNLEILNDIPPLTPDSRIEFAQLLFNELTFSHLPVVEGNQYLGSLSENDVRSFEKDKLIGDFSIDYEGFFVKEGVNELEVMETLGKYDTNVMPVLSQDKGMYLGYVELQEVISVYGDMPFLSEYGNVIVVQKGINDHSFSEICQIVESNNTKVLAVYVSNMERDVVQTTVKTSDGDMNGLLQTFRRYGYEIISDHYDDVFLKNLQERSRYLDKYLNM
ncbi:CBS domain-containing protein [Aquimarina agarilytica]|uniref:CBS domain-containing protein n=1 Tax=Aquimarina agarilytica TaxID=1087449 RepID=UPI000289ABC5|nr:CBS domain-containing protein [Aquimarina agarilytica]